MKYFALALLAIASLAAADDLPQWAREAAAQTVPSYPSKVEKVVLLHEEELSVDADGRRSMTERHAMRILQRGSSHVSASRSYDTRSGHIRDFRGWIIYPSGAVTPLGKKQLIEVGLSSDYNYEEVKMKVLDAGEGLGPGTVFAYEVVEEDKTVFTSSGYSFQETDPVLLSRFRLTVPPGWEVRSTIFNHQNFDPAKENGTSTWELKNLPWIEEEPSSPELHAIAPRLALTFFPTENRAGLQPLKDWPATSEWVSAFVDPSAEVTAEIREKAMQLTSHATSELDKIRAIAAFAQQTKYISVQLNLARGGGYTPHQASQILSRNYGDCKDKATLMRSLLKAVGIESQIVVIYSGDRTFVRSEWPSPMQFNHAIIGIRVSPETKVPSVLEHAKIGRLLFFDPTDPYTPVGDLPVEEQGSYALVVWKGNGDLIKVPLLPAAANRVDSTVEATLAPDGHLEARLVRQYTGQAACPLRRMNERRNEDELKKVFERGLTRRLGGITLTNVASTDQMSAGKLDLKLEFSARQFGQMMRDRMLVLRPGALVAWNEYSFTKKERTLPVKLEANMRNDSVLLKIPAGFKLDELPDPVQLQSPYGTYEASWSVEGADVRFKQAILVNDALVAPSDYSKVREFFDALASAQQGTVVMMKQ